MMVLFRPTFITALLFTAVYAPCAQAVPYNIMHYMMNEDAPSSLASFADSPATLAFDSVSVSATAPPVASTGIVSSAVEIDPVPSAVADSPVTPDPVSQVPPSFEPTPLVDASTNGAFRVSGIKGSGILLGTAATIIYLVL